MLRLIPRSPCKISIRNLCDKLRDANFPVTNRTVQRDLVELSAVFPLAADDREKPFGWSGQRDASIFDLPGLSVPEALTLTLVEQHLRNHLPPSALDALQPRFQSAARLLSSADRTTGSKAWLEKVRTIAPSQPLLLPVIDDCCQRTVYLALIQDQRLMLHYKKRDVATTTIYDVVHPLGIVQKGGRVYLVCMFSDYNDVRTLALHHIQQAHLIHEPAREKPGFDLDRFIASDEFGFKAGAPIVLRATFQRAAGEHLFETPLSPDQVLETAENGTLALTATVPSTPTLVFRLTGFGPAVVVHEPAQLRAEMKEIALGTAQAYSPSP